MIKFIIALILVQAFYCAEFPELENHIKLTWNNVSLEQKFDGSQTVSDKNGNVDGFILCATFNNGADNAECTFDYAYAEQTSSGTYSDSGSGKFVTQFVSKKDNKYSCLKFYNPIAGFKDVYDATLVKKGKWNVNYGCKAAEKNYTWWIVAGVIAGALVIVGMVFGVKYLKKSKAEKEGKTDGNALLQNA